MQLSTDTFCSCRENVWDLNRLIWRWPHSVILWFKGSRGSSAHSWKRHRAGGCQALNDTRLDMSRFFESTLEYKSFGLYRLKEKESISCLLLQYAPHFKAVFKDVIPQAGTHMRWSQCGWKKVRLHLDSTLRMRAGVRAPSVTQAPSITLAGFCWYGAKRA